MKIGGLEKFSTIDYPGYMSAVIFTTGCNYRCWYCQNSELWDENTPLIDEADVAAFLDKRSGFLEAVTITGGEPTLQKDLGSFMRSCRQKGYRIKLDTNGSQPHILGQILSEKLADYVAIDVKTNPSSYDRIGASDGASVLRSIDLLRRSSVPFEVRTTVLPDMDATTLRSMMEKVGPVPLWALQPYRVPDGADAPSEPLRTAAELEEMRMQLIDIQPDIVVRAR